MAEPVLAAEDVGVERAGRRLLSAVTLSVGPEDTVLVQGPSGAGKSTLFQVLGLLATPSSGRVLVDGTDAASVSERTRARLRRDHLGFVFQQFELIPDFTAWDNAAVPQDHTGERDEAWLDRVFARLDIVDVQDQYPATLSGGEQQRVAIARALANRPRVVLADEPTGQLDPETTERVMDLLFRGREFTETALVVTSHDRQIEDRFARVLGLSDGRLERGDTP
ncbi:MAG: ABC transporter ATP-binding protein [Haloarculaceae archaeon]